MRKHVILLALSVQACSSSVEGTGDIADISATGTTFDTEAESPSPTTGTTASENPDIPTTSGAGTGGGDPGSGSIGQPPMCGDGVIEGTEICDDGFEENKPTNACTSDCKPARCGDGHVQVSNGETCDDGEFNAASPSYNECSTSCARLTWCGDGIVQSEAGEECEPGAVDDDKSCGAMCRHKSRFVFLLGELTSGNLGGLAGADKRCNQAAADQPGLTGTYRAWLMVDGQTLADRFPEFAAPVAWNFTNTSAGLLAKSFAELVAMGPAQPVAFTEGGDALPEEYVWTGITKDGLSAGGDCGQWTSEAGSPALTGHSGYVPNVGPDALQWRVERKWTDRGIKSLCDQLNRFFCVQVAD